MTQNCIQFAVSNRLWAVQTRRLSFTIFSDGSGSASVHCRDKLMATVNLDRESIYLLRDKFVESVRIIKEASE